jgi:hypothetical protein
MNICPLCRASMRRWALCARAPKTPSSRLCVATAVAFRDECCHDDREKYEALVAKLNALPLKTSRLSIAIWSEIERIKNLHGGHKPVGTTFLAWRGADRNVRAPIQPATQLEAA